MAYRIHMKKTARFAIISLIPAFLILCWLSVNTVPAEVLEKNEQTATEKPEFVSRSFESALEDERSDLAGMEQRLDRWEIIKGSTLNEITAYRIQNTAHENLLLVLHTRLDILETALNDNRLAIKRLSERGKEFKEVKEIAPEWIAQISDRISIVEKRMAELMAEKSLTADNQKIHDKLNDLLTILHEKHQRGETFLKEYNQLYNQLERTASELEETGQRLEVRLRLQKSSELFERKPHPFAGVNIKQVSSEIKSAWDRTTDILEPVFWREQWLMVQRIGGIAQVLFIAFFLVAIGTRKKIRRTIQSGEKRLETFGPSTRRLALTMVRRSFLLTCAVILLWLYDLFELPHVNYHLATFINKTIITLLVTQWWIDYFQNGLGDSNSSVLPFVQNRCVNLFQGMRVLVITYLLLAAIFGTESVSTWIFRLAIETFLFIWCISFWRTMDNQERKRTNQEKTASPHALHFYVRGCMYAIFGLALLIDLIGYHALAEHWLVSWAKTFALFLWAKIGWRSIQEWHHAQKRASKGIEDERRPIAAAPVGWFLVQMARLAWLAAVFAGFLMAWTGSAFMLETLKQVISMDFSLGSLRISVKGILLAVVIFYVTHVANRIGRRLLSEKVLDARDFERGLKDSIVTISSYIIWGLGILLALGVLGVNATSLAVVFGALSIGIGFGLQNIFNNFISGLIILFERPIQVGDYVDVNGLWAEVKKINVRSTIVQTFDNATVIIPNSELISQQVTNWSFKDPRMRRHVDIGVAYGSDVELVRKTLLEIPDNISQILKYPRPDVLFLDHGDSALIFRLRYWAHVDDYYSTSTDVRFAVDHRFRELNIEIAFPQLDLHVRSDQTGTPSKKSTPEAPDPLPSYDLVKEDG
jgi:potassium efflux system protein